MSRCARRRERGRRLSQPGPSQSHRQIPVIVLAGFLGSGKTTLLNHLLHRSGGSRIGAIVNDFGAIEIDAMTVAGALGGLHGVAGQRLSVLRCRRERTRCLPGSTHSTLRPDRRHRHRGQWARRAAGTRPDAARQRESPGRVRRAGRGRRRRRVRRHAGEAPRDRPASGPRRSRRRSTRSSGSRTAASGSWGPSASWSTVPLSSPPTTGASTPSCSSTAGRTRSASGSCPSTTCTITEVTVMGSRTVLRTARETTPGICTPPTTVSPSAPRPPLHPRRLMDFLDSRPEGLYRIKGYVDFGRARPGQPVRRARRRAVPAVLSRALGRRRGARSPSSS